MNFKGFSKNLIIVIFAIVVVFGIVFYAVTQQNSVPQGEIITTQPPPSQQILPPRPELPAFTPAEELLAFHKLEGTGGFAGTLELTGYIDIQPWEREGEIGSIENMRSNTKEYAFFIVQQSSSELIYEYIFQSIGNWFITEGGIGLGCYDEEKGEIYSSNDGDFSVAENSISGEDLQKLLKSTKINPVRLRVTSPVFTDGSRAPLCYSHFRNFEVLSS